MDSELTKSERTEAAAAGWFARRASGRWTELDEAAFEAWLQAETANRIAYIRLEAAWNEAARLKALGAGVAVGVIPPRGSWGDTRFFRGLVAEGRPALGVSASPEESDDQQQREVRASGASASAQSQPVTMVERKRRRVFAMAAGLLLAVLAGGYLYLAGTLAGERYTTPVGGLDNVRLLDGSRITLNTDTSIRAVLTAKERRIELDRGEAFFDVAKDSSRPFVVYVGNKQVMAVGTKFAVRREADEEVEVVVTEGKVKLAALGAPDIPSPPAMLLAGTVAKSAKANVLVRQERAEEAEQLLSWRNGYVVFRDTTLADAVAEFNRYNSRKIVIQDEAIANIRVGGNFRSNNTDAFLALIQDGFPVSIEQGDARVILRAR